MKPSSSAPRVRFCRLDEIGIGQLAAPALSDACRRQINSPFRMTSAPHRHTTLSESCSRILRRGHQCVLINGIFDDCDDNGETAFVEDDALANPTASSNDGTVDNFAVACDRNRSPRGARTVDQRVGIVGACIRVRACH